MKSFLVTAFVLSWLSPALPSRPSEADIQKVLENQVKAWNAGDLEDFMAGYWNSPELTFYSGATKASGWLGTLERYRKRYQSEGKEMGQLEFSELNVGMLGADNAFVRGRWRLQMSDGSQPNGLFTLIFRTFPDGWKIIHDHTSSQ